MTTTLQCTHSPIAMTTTHFVVCHNDQSPITNNNISTAKFLGITLELLCIAFLAPLHWSPQVTAIQSLANQCYDIHFQIWCIPQLSKSNYYVLSGHEHLVATKSTPEPHNAYTNNLGAANPSKQCAKTSPTSNICIAIMNISLHYLWSLVAPLLLVLEAPNLPQSNLLPSHYNPPNQRWQTRQFGYWWCASFKGGNFDV